MYSGVDPLGRSKAPIGWFNCRHQSIYLVKFPVALGLKPDNIIAIHATLREQPQSTRGINLGRETYALNKTPSRTHGRNSPLASLSKGLYRRE